MKREVVWEQKGVEEGNKHGAYASITACDSMCACVHVYMCVHREMSVSAILKAHTRASAVSA